MKTEQSCQQPSEGNTGDLSIERDSGGDDTQILSIIPGLREEWGADQNKETPRKNSHCFQGALANYAGHYETKYY